MDRAVLHIIIILFLIAGCSDNKKQESDENNSMHDMPEMKKEEMSGMNHQAEKLDTGFKNDIAPANKTVLSNAQTIHPIIRNISDTIYAAGYIAFDERRNNKVAMRVSGRIEKLYLRYNYQHVHKGDKVLELYSPELNTYQEEFLHHLKTKSDSFLIEATKQKLKLLGLSVSQLNEIETIGQPLKFITIYSPYDGFIIYDFPQQQNSSFQNASAVSSGMNGMNSDAGAQQSTPVNQMQSGAKISEGDYVSKGQTLFVVNDCKEVYAIVAFDANEGAEIKTDFPVKIKSQLLPGEMINARINFIEPSFEEGQRFMQARVYLGNESLKLKANSVVSAELEVNGKYLVVPSSSVLSLGNRKFVWVKEESSQQGSKMLQAREVKVGREISGYMQVISGITPQDEIAKDAGYLLDSESLIKPE